MNKVVFIFCSEFPPLPGGIGNHALHLARALQQRKINVEVLTEHRGEDTREEEITFDISLPFPVTRVPRYKFIWRTYWERCFRAHNMLQSQTPGIVVASGKFQLWMAAGLSFFFPKWYFIAIIHGSEIGSRGSWVQLLTKWSLHRFNERIAVSHFTAQLVHDIHPQLSTVVIPNGFEPLSTDDIQQTLRLPGHPALITVGNVSYRKGQQNIIKVLPDIRQIFPDVHYHIVGIPSEQMAFEQLAQAIGVSKHVTFHGAVSQQQLPAILAGADIFLMLSERLPNGDVEGFGIAIVEANDLGLPAIGSNDSGIVDAIKDGYSGRLVVPHDAQSVCAALQDIMKNHISYSIQAKDWAKMFWWKKVIEDYLKVFNR